MIKITDDKKLNHYINKHNINNIFEYDIKKYMQLHYFKKGEHICMSGEKLENFYFFVSGYAKVYILLQNGKSLLIRFYKPLQILGELESINDTNVNCNIQAMDDCFCIAVPYIVIKEIIFHDKTFLRYICNHLAHKLSSASISSSINLLYPLENRLASYILATSTIDNTNSYFLIKSDNMVEVAELLGSSYRHLLRVLNKFCENNIIERKNKSIIIKDHKKLEDLAGDLYN